MYQSQLTNFLMVGVAQDSGLTIVGDLEADMGLGATREMAQPPAAVLKSEKLLALLAAAVALFAAAAIALLVAAAMALFAAAVAAAS